MDGGVALFVVSTGEISLRAHPVSIRRVVPGGQTKPGGFGYLLPIPNKSGTVQKYQG